MDARFSGGFHAPSLAETSIILSGIRPKRGTNTFFPTHDTGGHYGAVSAAEGVSFTAALQRHWPEYLIEGAELGLFMISACLFVALLEYPASPVHQLLPDPTLRRVLVGMAMGATAIAIIYSPIGQRSGAHFNPAVTLTFWRLSKVEHWDAFFYGLFQFIGGTIGVLLSALLLGMILPLLQ